MLAFTLQEIPTYELPPATATTLGGIKVGTGLTVESDGTLNNSVAAYTLPPATASALGGVIIGGSASGLQIDSSGNLSVLNEGSPLTLIPGPTPNYLLNGDLNLSGQNVGNLGVGGNLSVSGDTIIFNAAVTNTSFQDIRAFSGSSITVSPNINCLLVTLSQNLDTLNIVMPPIVNAGITLEIIINGGYVTNLSLTCADPASGSILNPPTSVPESGPAYLACKFRASGNPPDTTAFIAWIRVG